MGKTYRIAVVPGDGTGSEVVAEGIKVLDAVAARSDFALEFTRFNLGGEHFMATGELLPDATLNALATYDAIYLGAIGHPGREAGHPGEGHFAAACGFELDQYINLRPVKLYEGVPTPLKDKGPEDIDFVVVRENTEGLYAGAGGFLKKGTPRTRWRSRNPSTPARAWSAASGSPLSTAAGATGRRS